MVRSIAVEQVAEGLHSAARQLTGLDDFGATSYREGLLVLLESCLAEAGITDLGKTSVGQHIMGALIGRLVAEQNWRQHSGSLSIPVERPFVIVGLPRTATTALHRLLAEDPAHQGPELWLLQAPQPRPPRDTWEQNPMFQAIRQGVDAVFEVDPDLRWVHDIRAELVDESWQPLEQNFTSQIFEIMAVKVPSYSAWLAAQDLTPAYERQRDVLRLIGSPSPDRRWVIKDPTHIFGGDALFNVYPDAMVIHAHRHPRHVIPSVCDLISRAKIASGDSVDLHEFGAAQLEVWSRGVRNFLGVRVGRPEEQFFDFSVREFARDPLAVVRRAYERFGLELSGEAEVRMTAWMAAHPSGGHKSRPCDAATFGLAEEQIDDAFAEYIEAFELSDEI